MTCYLEKQYEKIRKMSKSVDKEGGFDHPTEHSYPQSWFVPLKSIYFI
jgi:hypothetical protein